MRKLVLGISLLISLWLLSQTLNTEPDDSNNMLEQSAVDDSKLQAENFMNRIELKEFSSDGYLQARLTSPEMIQYTGQDYAEIAEPVVRLSDSAEGQWDLTSNRGRYDFERKNIEFEGKVILTQQDSGQTLLELKTEALIYQIHNELLRTQTPIAIKHLTGQYQANMLSLDLKTQELYLGKGVIADYES